MNFQILLSNKMKTAYAMMGFVGRSSQYVSGLAIVLL